MSRIRPLYAVRNNLSGEWFNPAPFVNEQIARRAFNELPGEDAKKHPEEYELWECGTWDDSKGQIMGHNVPKLIQRGVEHDREDNIPESINKE